MTNRPRRIAWNIYAWPITLLLLASYGDTIAQLGPVGIMDVLVSIPSLVALHLHVWNKRVLGGSFWRPYAFVLLVWDLTLNLLLAPMITGKSGQIIGLALLLPVYVAVFKYAFRRWPAEKLPDPRAGSRSSTFGTSGPRQFWLCPHCHRHVSARLMACQCGFSRQDMGGVQFATPTGEHVLEGGIGSRYVKAKLLEKPCPRCGQPSSVDVYLLAPVWRVGLIVVILAIAATGFSDIPYHQLAAMLVPWFAVLSMYVGSRAKCRSCGAMLRHTLFGRWA